ncbi:hypothetical protein D3C84_1247020 [compost metagenome]
MCERTAGWSLSMLDLRPISGSRSLDAVDAGATGLNVHATLGEPGQQYGAIADVFQGHQALLL